MAPPQRLKIGILLDAVYPYHQGGRETLHFERSTRLVRQGHSVRTFTAHWWPEREREIVRDGVAFRAIGPKVRMYTRGGRRSIWQTVVFTLSAVQLLWAPEFDVLDVDQFPFGHFFVARLICRLRGKPMTATWHEVWDRDYWRDYMGKLGPIGVFLQRNAARSADLIFADSRLTARRLVEILGVEPQRVIVLQLGITIPSPIADSSPSGGAPASASKTVDCIFIGRLLPHKHVDVLLRALMLTPGVTGLIVGEGPEQERLIALAGELGITDRVRFESPATHEAVLDRLRRARLFVLPSTREGFGIAVLEANACSVPALVVQHPDNAAMELVRDGVTGIICGLGPEPMAAQIRAYLADPHLQSRMSKAARATAATYSWDAYVNKMEATLTSLVGDIPGPLTEEGQGRGQEAA